MPILLQWLEKYRPKEIKDIVGNDDTVGRLQVLAEQGNMPNLILSGPPGTGKTTSVLALAHALLGDAFKDAVSIRSAAASLSAGFEIDAPLPRQVLELNASDDRGIDVVRNRCILHRSECSCWSISNTVYSFEAPK